MFYLFQSGMLHSVSCMTLSTALCKTESHESILYLKCVRLCTSNKTLQTIESNFNGFCSYVYFCFCFSIEIRNLNRKMLIPISTVCFFNNF